ncbi:MAG: T9SS type A sorting domain-containing protein [bacterium]|jgi:hypothetical protein|nr:T9SS type A sorting domain-containing protein [bacterium]
MKNNCNLRNKVLLLLLLAVAGIAKAQTHEFAPIGAEWHYGRVYREGWDFTGVAYDRFRSIRTFEINGWECKEIELYQHLDEYGLENPHTVFYYITQEEDRVYEVEDGQRLLLYDFGKNPGESWYAPKYDVEVYVVDTSTMTLEDGSIRKVMETSLSGNGLPDYLYLNNIIEGIGLDMSLFPFVELDGPPQSIHDYIRCYSENGVPLIVSETECDYEIFGVEEHEGVSIASMNTVVESLLHIDFAEAASLPKQIRIANVSGRIMYVQKTVGKSLDISFADQPAGVYVVQIVTDSKVFNNKIVKK